MIENVETVTVVAAHGSVHVTPRAQYWDAYGKVMRESPLLELSMVSNVALCYSRIYRNGKLFATVIPTTH